MRSLYSRCLSWTEWRNSGQPFLSAPTNLQAGGTAVSDFSPAKVQKGRCSCSRCTPMFRQVASHDAEPRSENTPEDRKRRQLADVAQRDRIEAKVLEQGGHTSMQEGRHDFLGLTSCSKHAQWQCVKPRLRRAPSHSERRCCCAGQHWQLRASSSQPWLLPALAGWQACSAKHRRPRDCEASDEHGKLQLGLLAAHEVPAFVYA